MTPPRLGFLWGQAGRFGAVGVFATAVHAAVLGLGLARGLPAGAANGLAFAVAVFVTYWGQRLWVFGRPPRSLPRFAAVACAGLCAHGAGMPALNALGVGVWPAWACLTVAIPALSFALSRFWVFGRVSESG